MVIVPVGSLILQVKRERTERAFKDGLRAIADAIDEFSGL